MYTVALLLILATLLIMHWCRGRKLLRVEAFVNNLARNRKIASGRALFFVHKGDVDMRER